MRRSISFALILALIVSFLLPCAAGAEQSERIWGVRYFTDGNGDLTGEMGIAANYILQGFAQKMSGEKYNAYLWMCISRDAAVLRISVDQENWIRPKYDLPCTIYLYPSIGDNMSFSATWGENEESLPMNTACRALFIQDMRLTTGKTIIEVLPTGVDMGYHFELAHSNEFYEIYSQMENADWYDGSAQAGSATPEPVDPNAVTPEFKAAVDQYYNYFDGVAERADQILAQIQNETNLWETFMFTAEVMDAYDEFKALGDKAKTEADKEYYDYALGVVQLYLFTGTLGAILGIS